MGTQVATMKSTQILRKVVTDPRLPTLAPKWSNQYMDGGNIDVVTALKDIEKMVSVSSIPKTYLIRMGVSAGDKNDAAGLATMVKDAYRNNLNTAYNREITSRKQAIRDSIQDANDSITELTARKARLVREGRIDSIDSARSTSSEKLRLINAQLVNIQQTVEALSVIRANDEAQLQRDTGIEYDSSLRADIEISPMMLTFKQELKRLETALVGLQEDGVRPGHRQYKQVINQINAHQRKLENTREELLREAFEARVQNTIQTLQQLRAQELDLTTQKDDLEEKLTELTRTSEEINDLDRQIEASIRRLGEQQEDLSDLDAAAELTSSRRVSVLEDVTVPDLPTFPVLLISLAGGMMVIVGLTTGCIVLFEALDQRIKSASDIRMIPRTRSLGVLMDASEDPSSPEKVATVFADAPGSVFAEHIRQLRTSVSSALNRAGHHSMVVVGAMPKSGATSVIVNLASANAASGVRTLVIDANMRRPGVHKVLGLADAPGLGDVLAGEATFESCVAQVENGPSVLPVGTTKNRLVERLSSAEMKELLQGCRESYDLVLIDVAPSIVAGDAAILANVVDATMLVVRAMSEKRGQVARMSRELGEARAEFIGVLVNGVRSAAGGYMRKNIRTSFNYRVAEDAPSKDSKKDAKGNAA
ncbi:MAG: hypothetical protein JJ974_08585 [Phycisphaerales bacterium]|nr:hypothetical protein [Phycisphaerales bacterium]